MTILGAKSIIPLGTYKNKNNVPISAPAKEVIWKRRNPKRSVSKFDTLRFLLHIYPVNPHLMNTLSSADDLHNDLVLHTVRILPYIQSH